MARATTSDYGYLWRIIGRTAIYNLVIGVQGDIGIGESQAMKSRANKVRRIVDKVLRRHGGVMEGTGELQYSEKKRPCLRESVNHRRYYAVPAMEEEN